MSDLVTLSHPDLPGQPIRIDRRRIGPRLAAGWQETESPAPVEEQAESDEPTESAQKRRGRKSTEEQ